MKRVQATIDLPEDLYLSLSGVGITRDQIVSESKKLLALKYFQTKILSLEKATELSGLSKWRFIEYLSQNNIPIIDYDDEVIYIPEAVFQEVTEASEQRSRAPEVKESERPFPIDLNLPLRCLQKGRGS
ncbi:MAG: UPF0175 family protein [Thioploca sp.]|nr:UPF0175 family protein [Thioploca sp.]